MKWLVESARWCSGGAPRGQRFCAEQQRSDLPYGDPTTTGSATPGAAVTVTNSSTQVAAKSTTGPDGFYQAANLPVGTYEVSVEASGFNKVLKTGFDLPDNGRISVDFRLEVGVVTESVTVTASVGEAVNTVSGEVHTIDSEQVGDMALNGRNYMQLPP